MRQDRTRCRVGVRTMVAIAIPEVRLLGAGVPEPESLPDRPVKAADLGPAFAWIDDFLEGKEPEATFEVKEPAEPAEQEPSKWKERDAELVRLLSIAVDRKA